MNNILKITSIFMLLGVLISSCSSDEETSTATFELNINGLEDLGDNFIYEGWIIVDGAPVTTGTFEVSSDGTLSQTEFAVSEESLEAATTFVLTIEPSPDPSPEPSDVHILAGDFSGNSADLTVDHGAAIGENFVDAAGGYILATPTDGGSDTDENSGVWWLNPAAGPGAGLDLPVLPSGWIYEGWAVVDGTPISTGRFTSVTGSDDFNGYSGDQSGPAFPGEDFLSNAPEGFDFPVDLAGKTVVISVEPVPDNSPAPFTLKPLVGPVDEAAVDHFFYDMINNASNTNPTGSINRNL